MKCFCEGYVQGAYVILKLVRLLCFEEYVATVVSLNVVLDFVFVMARSGLCPSGTKLVFLVWLLFSV